MEKDRQKGHASSEVQKKVAGLEASANLGTHGTRSQTRARGAGCVAV